MYLDKASAEVSQGDIFESLPLTSVEGGQAHMRQVRAMLLTQDCEYDKPSNASVLIAEILPLSGVASGSRGTARDSAAFAHGRSAAGIAAADRRFLRL